MSYIGNPIVSTDFPVDYFSGNGSTTAFTLSVAPASVNAIDVQVSGVSQSPQTYSVSGTTLTFSAAPPTGSSNIVVRHQGIAGSPNVPALGSVTPAMLNPANSVYWDVNGNVGVGTTSTNQSISGKAFTVNAPSGAAAALELSVSNSNKWYINTDGTAVYDVTVGSQPRVTYVNGSERMRIDTSGNVGIGTSSPSYKVDIRIASESSLNLYNTTATSNDSVQTQISTYGAYWNQLSFNASSYVWKTYNTERIRINSSGYLGIGTNNPQAKLDVYGGGAYINAITGGRENGAGNFHIDSSGGSCYINWFTGNGLVVGNGTSGGTGSVLASAYNISDRNEKENIEYFSNGLDKILQLKPATFNFIGKSNTEAGLIAQDVQEVLPEMVKAFRKPDAESDTLSLSNTGLFPYLINAIQELNAKVEAQALEIQALKGTA